MTLDQLLREQGNKLEAAGVSGAEADLHWIVGAVTHFNRVQLIINKEFILPQKQIDQIRQYVDRRCKREPLQYILGSQYFLNLKLKTDKRALIPRPETELLAELCISMIKREYPRFKEFRLLDIGTGTGALALGIAKAASNVRAIGVDISYEALSLARENCRACKLEERVELRYSDIFSGVENEMFDGIVSNPPYIPSKVVDELEPEVKDYEPRLALDGGEYGFDFYYRIITNAARYLKSGGFIALEAEHFQFDPIRDLLKKTEQFTQGVCISDYSGQSRICWAKKL